MLVKRILVLLASSCLFFAAQARAAEVAVMPVLGTNLSQGDCDAIGVLFANAFARDARVVVASPLVTKPLVAEHKTPAAITEALGASQYVELRAARVAERVDVNGVLRTRDGALVYQAQTSAWTLDAMDGALTVLARALIWRQPIAAGVVVPGPAVGSGGGDEGAAKLDAGPKPSATSRGYGPKVGLVVPRASGRSISPSFLIQFDGRIGPRDYFLEFGAGLLVPTDENYGSSSTRVGGGFLEIGGSLYLWSGNAAMYLGGGVSPAILVTQNDYDSHIAATCGAYGQAGITFTRDSRAKIYAEFRLTQLLLPIEGASEDIYGTAAGGTFYPMMLSFQGGVGF